MLQHQHQTPMMLCTDWFSLGDASSKELRVQQIPFFRCQSKGIDGWNQLHTCQQAIYFITILTKIFQQTLWTHNLTLLSGQGKLENCILYLKLQQQKYKWSMCSLVFDMLGHSLLIRMSQQSQGQCVANSSKLQLWQTDTTMYLGARESYTVCW